ncbi:hypothetical protein AMTR_s00059p00072490 [Amborella trichopoda]|uniref:SWI/SNF complex subunit SWI3D n=1 Tax=Amborella trichopoda TaxID=13333 RepID=U5D7V5_AMBTC|nr:hypothetical protein AMTR_s00059p00072490 [Amborella trichopoda]
MEIQGLCCWFSWTKVHPLEERALVSFFNGKSEKRNPDLYMHVRNSIIKKFHNDPQTQLTVEDLSDQSIGDFDAVHEVMAFLDHWGLINFHPFPPNETLLNSNETSKIDKMAFSLEKLYQFEKVQSRSVPKVVTKGGLSAPAVPPPNMLTDSSIPDVSARPEGPAVEYHCNSCSADCSRKRYHCQKQADFDLCSECYNDGKFGSGMAPADFILMEPATEMPGVSGGSWTNQETLLLLEALELYGENWNEIAEHVATKTKSQCILHFIQMPVEDPFLEGKEPTDMSIQGAPDTGSTSIDVSLPEAAPPVKGTDSEEAPESLSTEPTKPKEEIDVVEPAKESVGNFVLDALKRAFEAVRALSRPGGSLSFGEAGNPVMALVAFLAAMVDPEVATDSTRSSMKAILEDSPGIQLAMRHSFLLEDSPEDVKDPPASQSTTPDTVDVEVQKEENHSSTVKEGEAKKNDTVNSVSLKDNKDPLPNNELGQAVSPSSLKERKEDPVPPKESEDTITPPMSMEKSDNVIPAKESGETTMPSSSKENTEKDPSIKENMEKASPVEENTEKAAPPIKENTAKASPMREPSETVSSSSLPDNMEKPSTSNGLDEANPLKTLSEATAGLDRAKAVEKMAESVPSEAQVPQQRVVSDSAPEAKENTGEENARERNKTVENNCKPESDAAKETSNIDNRKPNASVESKDGHKEDRLKHAALSALSATAVKAKLLAKQEEETIQQLVLSVIEKQLQKLEVKMGPLFEMERANMRIREPIDKARQRLYHERAQIIAARFGYPPPTSRAAALSSNPTGKTPLPNSNTVSSQPPIANPPRPTKPLVPASSLLSSATGHARSSHVMSQDGLPSTRPNLPSVPKV